MFWPPAAYLTFTILVFEAVFCVSMPQAHRALHSRSSRLLYQAVVKALEKKDKTVTQLTLNLKQCRKEAGEGEDNMTHCG